MKKIPILLLCFFSMANIFSQDITGQWNGMLKVQGIQLRLVFNISKTDSGYRSTMDSPDQGAKGIPVTSTIFENQEIKLSIASAKIDYTGKLGANNIIIGTFKQAGQQYPMDLSRDQIEKVKMNRPQEPQKPYPYYVEDVKFENTRDNIELAGTLTMPSKEGNFPAVILITGSGPQNRDEALLGHKPFLVIADHLTRHGIAVLRFDDRGVASSKGDFKSATTFDFSYDVESAINYLLTRKEINGKKIGLVGHSEGGVIAPMVAARNKQVDFIVMLAGTGIRGDELLLLQQELIGRASGETDTALLATKKINRGAFDLVIRSVNTDSLKKEMIRYIKSTLKDDEHANMDKASEDAEIQKQVEQVTSPWMLYFIKYDPFNALTKVSCPVLAINGSKDLQVPPKENLSAIKAALDKGKNKKYITKELPNLNHLFQECKTGSPAEYAEIEQTFSPIALDEMTNWILIQVK